MNLQRRISLMSRLGNYMQSSNAEWQQVQARASNKNGWFTPEFIKQACDAIANSFLQEDQLAQWAGAYEIADTPAVQKNVGIVMAGNIPLVGFHDFLAVFISGHKQTIKLSSKDDVLLPHLIQKLAEWDEAVSTVLQQQDVLKGCDAYIATGSNNSSRYFEQYFGKYPHIIRKNRTSVAVLTGNETEADLEKLSDDIHLYFGLGCRNVSKVFVPRDYDFVPLLKSFDKYSYFADHHKYKNNYDYQLSIILLANHYYMTNGSTLLSESDALFSPISQVYFEYYDDEEKLEQLIQQNQDLQCIVSQKQNGFGVAQQPGLHTYADGVDTMQFLQSL